MAKPPRQPVTAATIAAAIASAPTVATDGATTGAPVSTPIAPATEPAVQNEQAPVQATDIAEQTTVEEVDDEPVEGRVLIAFDDYLPNEIFVGRLDESAELEAAQKIDCDPKAVAYAKSLIEG